MKKLLPVFLSSVFCLLFSVFCFLSSVTPVSASILSDFSDWLAPQNPSGIEGSGPYQKLLPKEYQDSHPISDALSPSDRAKKASAEIHAALSPKKEEGVTQALETQDLSPADLLKKLVASIFGYSADERELAFIPALTKPREASLEKYCQGGKAFYSLPAYCSQAKEAETAGAAAQTEGIEDLIPYLGTIKIAKNFMLDSLMPRELQK